LVVMVVVVAILGLAGYEISTTPSNSTTATQALGTTTESQCVNQNASMQFIQVPCPSSSTTSTLSEETFSTQSINTNGLSLELSLNFKNSVNQTLSIEISLYNSLTSQDNVTASSDWSLGSIGQGFGPCTFDNAPYQIAVYQGNYDLPNFSQNQLLQVVNPDQIFTCPSLFSFHWYLFWPSSDNATFLSCLGNNYTSCSISPFPASFSEALSANGSYARSGNSTSFAPFNGFYTVAAEDEWGDVAILHFDTNTSH